MLVIADVQLIERIKNYIVSDANSKIQDPAGHINICDLRLQHFSRGFNDWCATVTIPDDFNQRYEVSYNSLTNKAVVNVYTLQKTQEAII